MIYLLLALFYLLPNLISCLGVCANGFNVAVNEICFYWKFLVTFYGNWITPLHRYSNVTTVMMTKQIL